MILAAALLLSLPGFAQNIQRAEPLSWWVGMNTPLQVMFYGEGIGTADVEVIEDGVRVTQVHRAESPNYLFVDVEVDSRATAGDYTFRFTQGNGSFTHPYHIGQRREGSRDRQSFTTADMVYLIMPDRFANGDPSNDNTDDTTEKADRSNFHGRHGGDIQGIIDHLDYIASIGATAIWSTPLTLDNDRQGSYHQYATSDYYKIDPRFGTNDLYKEMVREAHRHGLKIIMDVVTKHCGITHWWMEDLPFADWINQFPQYTGTTHAMALPMAPNSSKYDQEIFYRGWFTGGMPDMNLANPYVLQYFKQWAVWWIENMDIDGLRVDTYPYNDKYAMAEWVRSVLDEYPNLSIVGESWHGQPSQVAYWVGGQHNYDGFDSHLPMGMDFPLMNAVIGALGENNRRGGVNAMYEVLTQDFLFRDPNRLMIFLDNHDTDHLADFGGGDPRKSKIGIALLATMRGMPQVWVGTELMFQSLDRSQGHGSARIDFPRGWPGDERDLFTVADRTPEEEDVFEYFTKLFNWRKGKDVLHNGGFMQFYSRDNNYVYFRYNDNEAVMTVLNFSAEPRTIGWDRYAEMIGGIDSGYDIVSETTVPTTGPYEIAPYGTAVIEFTK